MIDSLLNFIAPHPCLECGKLGSPLCDNCKYNIESEPFELCIACGSLSGKNGICRTCRVPYSRAWCVGERTGTLQRLVDAYKFERAKACHRPLADLLVERLPQLPADTVVVPIPTVVTHIRQRGYDHTDLVARRVAKRLDLRLERPLARNTSATQRGTSRRVRTAQARRAFKINTPPLLNRPYLIIDDVVTTGATLKYATQALKDAGVMDVWVAVVARQSSTE